MSDPEAPRSTADLTRESPPAGQTILVPAANRTRYADSLSRWRRNLRLRVAILTQDASSREVICKAVRRSGHLPMEQAQSQRAIASGVEAADCDAAILDAGWLAHSNSTSSPGASATALGVAGLLLVGRRQLDVLPMFLRQRADNEFFLLSSDAAALRQAVHRFLDRGDSIVDTTSILCRGDYRLVPGLGDVHIVDRKVSLSPRKFKLAYALFLHQSKALSYGDLHKLAWGSVAGAAEIVKVKAHVSVLEQLLELDGRNGFRLRRHAAAYELCDCRAAPHGYSQAQGR